MAETAWRPVAGGTDLLVQIAADVSPPPERVLDIWGLDELRGINLEGDELVIGALTTYTDLRASALVAELLPALTAAAATIGAAQIQNRGTIGGNLVNASPAGDTLPIWLATDSQIVLGSAGGERSVPAGEFFPSYRVTARRDDELVLRVRRAAAPPAPRPVPQGRDPPRAGHQQGRARPVVDHRGGRSVAQHEGGARIGGGDPHPRRGHGSRARRPPPRSYHRGRGGGRPGGGNHSH